MAVNEARLRVFLSRAFYDLAAAQSAALVVVGDRLGLYKALRAAGPLTAEELAARTGTDSGYVAAWLANQVCGEYVEYDPASERFQLSEEQALALADEGGRAFVSAAFQAAAGLVCAQDRVVEAFRTGVGIPREAYGPDVQDGMARTARARYQAHLLKSWIPALEGMAARLEAGAEVADLGCGQGQALLVLAAAYPRSRFVGFDSDAAALERARASAREAGLASLRFERASALEFPGRGYQLVTCFDSLHEMRDPLAVAARVRAALAEEGSWLVVEPYASDRLEQNVGPGGRYVSSLSALHCLPVTRADGGPGLGALLGEQRLAGILRAGGFGRVRKAAEVAESLVLEARP